MYSLENQNLRGFALQSHVATGINGGLTHRTVTSVVEEDLETAGERKTTSGRIR